MHKQLVGLVALAGWVSVAHAFTFETVVSEGCHEKLSLRALERVGWPQAASAPALTRDEQVLLANLPFRAPAQPDLWKLSLVLGVRNNDVHGASPTELPEFAAAQLGTQLQGEHCLRGPEDDYADGNRTALEACRDFVLSEVSAALGQGDDLDLSQTEPVQVALSFQSTTAQLPRFSFRMGRAFHAIQDSYTHTLRSQGIGPVRTVFNFIDPALRGDYTALRDGFGHLSRFDGCTGLDAAEAQRVEAATDASARLLAAVASPEGGRRGRLQRAALVLEQILHFEGCEGQSCDPASEVPAVGCQSLAGGPVVVLAAAFALLFLRRPRPAARQAVRLRRR